MREIVPDCRQYNTQNPARQNPVKLATGKRDIRRNQNTREKKGSPAFFCCTIHRNPSLPPFSTYHISLGPAFKPILVSMQRGNKCLELYIRSIYRSGLTMPLSRHSVGIYPETSSHVTCQGTVGHSRLSSLSHCALILAYRVELVCAS